MNKHLLRTLVLCSTTCLLQAALPQESDSLRTDKKDPRPLKDRLYFGGGLGLTFGNVTNILVAPRVGYKVDQKGKFSVGIGGDYQYTSINTVQYSYRANNYGYSVFTRYRILEPVFLNAEFQHLSFGGETFSGVERPRFWVPFLWLGGGYAARLGGNTYMVAQIAWDVIQDDRSPFFRGNLRGTGPITSVGIVAGF